ncbi:MAG: YigZ family protein [Saprospiraceae bacterium]
MTDSYKTITGHYTAEFKDRGSKFIAYAFPAYTEEEWQAHLQEVKQEHFKARHHCYAYRLGIDQNNFRANDDGEPSGTAGRPILGQIDKMEVTNVFIVVVRYFGGTKLGTSGLINAYRESARLALEKATIIERIIEDVYQLEFGYSLMSSVMNAVKKLELDICKQEFSEKGEIHFAVRQSEVEQTLKRLKAAILDLHLAEVEELEKTEGFDLEYLYTR